MASNGPRPIIRHTTVVDNSSGAWFPTDPSGAISIGGTMPAVFRNTIIADNNEIMARDNGAYAPLYLNRDGANVVIGGSDNGYRLHCNGSAAKPGGGSWSNPSDINLKNINGSFNHGLSELLQLSPVAYNYKPGNVLDLPSNKEYIGLVAQEVQKVIPEAVETMGSGYLALNNDPIIWTMLNAIKEQQQTITKLKEKLSEMEALKVEMENIKRIVTNQR